MRQWNDGDITVDSLATETTAHPQQLAGPHATLGAAHLVVQRVPAGTQELWRQRQRRLERLRVAHPQAAAVEVDQQRLAAGAHDELVTVSAAG